MEGVIGLIIALIFAGVCFGLNVFKDEIWGLIEFKEEDKDKNDQDIES